MKISTRGRYALQLMLDLANHYDSGPINIKDIARRQGISDKYLEQIVAVLNRALLVKSSRGAKGGYQLTGPPESYTVGKILRTMEGDFSPVDCVGVNGVDCEKRENCVTVRIWERLYDAINEVLEDIRLSDLVLWQKEIQSEDGMNS